MRTFLVLLTVACTLALHAQEGCAWEEPNPGMILTVDGCGGQPACPHGTALQLGLQPFLVGMQPPWIFYYELSPCDEVTWDFGDGSPLQTAPIGTADVAHTWAAPGNYTITAAVRNELGSHTFSTSRVISSQPSTVSWPTLPSISETAKSVSIRLRRTGSTANRVAVTLAVTPPAYWPQPAIAATSIPVVFEPGQTEQAVTLPVHDNALYDGPRPSAIHLTNAQGGVFLQQGWLEIVDDEPRPTINCASVSVREGDSGRTRVTVPCTLSAPMGSYLNLFGALRYGTATAEDFMRSEQGSQIAGGQTSGTIQFDVYGDTEVERNEQLTFAIGGFFSLTEPIAGPPAVITILNDDAALRGSHRRATAGELVTFTVIPGAQYEQPTEIALGTSEPSVLRVPATVLVPPGADEVTFVAETLAEGVASVEADLGTRVVTADLLVHELRAIAASASTLTMTPGATATLTLSLTPASTAPVAVLLTGDPRIVEVPATAIIPPGGEVRVDVRGVAAGSASIAITSGADGVSGTAVMADVVQARKRRSAR